MTQYAWQYLLDKFDSNGNVLHTLDFATDVHLACEYRRLLSSDLPRKGYQIETTKVGPKSWRYTLLPSQPSLIGVRAA